MSDTEKNTTDRQTLKMRRTDGRKGWFDFPYEVVPAESKTLHAGVVDMLLEDDAGNWVHIVTQDVSHAVEPGMTIAPQTWSLTDV